MSGKFQAIGSVLQSALKRLHIDRQVHESSCLVLWDRVVGRFLASVTQPERFRSGILYVNTRSPSWAQELEFHKADLIARLNERLGRAVVRDIRFQPKGLKRQPLEASGLSDPAEEPAVWDHIELNLEEWSRISDEVSDVANPELKSRLESLLIRQTRLFKWREAHGWRPCTQCRALHDTPYPLCPICRLPQG